LFVGESKANQFLETSSDHEQIPGLLLWPGVVGGGGGNLKKKLTTVVVGYNGKFKISVSTKKKKIIMKIPRPKSEFQPIYSRIFRKDSPLFLTPKKILI
jgi:hypothetical protein